MNCTLSSFIAFAAGAAIGSFVAWKISKDRYEELMKKETEELREYYSNKKIEAASEPVDYEGTEEELCEHQEEKREYADKVSTLGYTNYSDISRANENEEVDDTRKPYVIAPEEFGTKGDYETVSLTYYSDGVLADELDYIIEDVEDTVGKDSLTHFGEYEDDSVFVRNERLECDYEILLDSRKYSDVVGPTNPLGVD